MKATFKISAFMEKNDAAVSAPKKKKKSMISTKRVSAKPSHQSVILGLFLKLLLPHSHGLHLTLLILSNKYSY